MAVVRGFVAPTDHGWYQFLRARPELTEVNFWRPSGKVFNLAPGAPFFFKLKSPHNAIGGFGLFARAQRLPVWQAWDVFGQANGTKDEHDLLVRLDRLGGADTLGLGRNRPIGCVAITEPVFFTPDEWVAPPNDWARNIVSGRAEDLTHGDGLRMWKECLERAAVRRDISDWAREAIDAQRAGKPVLITPRLGQSSFRLAVLEAYGQQCAVTTEHSLPVIDAAHIRPWAAGGTHSIPNGVPLRRDLHRLFDLGYVTIRTDMRLAVSGKLRDDYANGRAYYELDGRKLHLPDSAAFRPDAEALAGINQRCISAAEEAPRAFSHNARVEITGVLRVVATRATQHRDRRADRIHARTRISRQSSRTAARPRGILTSRVRRDSRPT